MIGWLFILFFSILDHSGVEEMTFQDWRVEKEDGNGRGGQRVVVDDKEVMEEETRGAEWSCKRRKWLFEMRKMGEGGIGKELWSKME